jgi:hypothetical protein
VEDALWPDESTILEVGSTRRRLRALEEVLSTLPPEPYQRLKEQAARFDWFIPGEAILGQVRPVRARSDCTRRESEPGPWTRVVYLSPLLEQQDWAVMVTSVVHELAHIILGHRLFDLDREEYGQQEQAARRALREWGFQMEADQADHHLRNLAMNRWYPGSQQGIRPAGPTTIG